MSPTLSKMTGFERVRGGEEERIIRCCNRDGEGRTREKQNTLSVCMKIERVRACVRVFQSSSGGADFFTQGHIQRFGFLILYLNESPVRIQSQQWRAQLYQ